MWCRKCCSCIPEASYCLLWSSNWCKCKRGTCPKRTGPPCCIFLRKSSTLNPLHLHDKRWKPWRHVETGENHSWKGSEIWDMELAASLPAPLIRIIITQNDERKVGWCRLPSASVFLQDANQRDYKLFKMEKSHPQENASASYREKLTSFSSESLECLKYTFSFQRTQILVLDGPYVTLTASLQYILVLLHPRENCTSPKQTNA